LNRKLLVYGSILVVLPLAIPVTASPRLSLTSTFHVSPLPLQIYDIVLTTPTPAFVWNLTANLNGKDAGSDKFSLIVDVGGGAIPPLLLLLSDRNLTSWLSTPLTTHGGQELAYWAAVPNPFAAAGPIASGTGSRGTGDTINFSPPASGTYHIAILNPNAFQNMVPGVSSNVHVEIHGTETWTTTTIA
jgi:hypothetical protein